MMVIKALTILRNKNKTHIGVPLKLPPASESFPLFKPKCDEDGSGMLWSDTSPAAETAVSMLMSTFETELLLS